MKKSMKVMVNDILVNDLFYLSKFEREGEALENKDFEVRNCVEEVLMLFAVRKGAGNPELAYCIHSQVPDRVNGDRKRLSQVLINLIENAITSTSQGEVFLDIRSRPCKLVNKIELVFKLRDTGSGIPANKINRLFKVTRTEELRHPAEAEPKGPGLVVCKNLIESMGGTISILSEPGIGATFIFNIFFTPALNPEHASIMAAPLGSGKRTVVTSPDVF